MVEGEPSGTKSYIPTKFDQLRI